MLRFLADGGECAKLIRAHDWSSSPLGPPEAWSPTLKTNVATMLGSRFPQSLFWGPDLILIYNDGYAPMLGNKPVAIGKPLREAWSDVWAEIEPIAQRALAGEPTFIEDFELTTERSGVAEKAWFTFCYSPVRDEYGAVVGVLDTVVETTQTVLARERIQLLNSELAHRMKNTFSVINAIAAQTFGTGDEDNSPQVRFAERLNALSSAQHILLEGSMGRAAIGRIISGTLAPHLPARDVTIVEGPDWQLTGKQVFALALAIHELATNAAKYGALSVPDGRIAVRWNGGTPGTDDPFELIWQETGVGRLDRPKRTGFGTRLITRVLPMEFGGSVELAYGDDGLRFVLSSSMRNLGA